MFWDFIQFTAKIFFIMLIVLGGLLLLFAIDFTYYSRCLWVFITFFAIRLL